ncbi:3'(2'),5'-bisphosphate nucleotidase CysQ [Kiloniella laminariae]|uniref:3'(2'),5'-bisphosphate nucleotidase CysQ n=1 Tax=Kiloniella laminariae TaxID=454162 RepID=A0ABT4LNX4_9PROT|nr:3'(2'),5'-bisphosphate nucleotidase CysQ [Kiloniella laminariae]MCZ4282850.1 3'(2'),5'-bisphosphate nucleotidase CysQ [Kiloniella laminariae]
MSPLQIPAEIPVHADNRDLMNALLMIAQRAGEIVMEVYNRQGEIEVQTKDDASPVTEADQAAEAFILGALNTVTPDIPVVSEEAASKGEIPSIDDGLFWLVDPLDGTKEFINRNGEFTVNIGLIENGVPVAGVVHAPAKGQTWVSADLCVFFEEGYEPIVAQVRSIPEEGATVVASRRHGDNDDLAAFLESRKVYEQISAGSSLKICLIATGRADLYPRFGPTMEWDTAAAHAVLLAAGGHLSDADGDPLTYGKHNFRNPYFVAEGEHLDAGFDLFEDDADEEQDEA